MKNILITGAAGFVGSFLAREFCLDHNVIVLVRPGTQNFSRLEEIQHKITVVEHDLSMPWPDIANIDIVLHAGGNASSESCIKDPFGAINNNVVSTLQALEFARRNNCRFVYYSTGEVFGATSPGHGHREYAPLSCTSPYAVTKAAGAEMARAYWHCHGVKSSVIHINNTFGEYCQPNRFPVIAIRAVLQGIKLTIHQDAQGQIASRRWFHVADVASHTKWILDHQVDGFGQWNSAGSVVVNNLEFAKMIAEAADRPLDYQLQISDRPGHTACYDIDPCKLYQSGWKPLIELAHQISRTVDWYQQNPQWLENK